MEQLMPAHTSAGPSGMNLQQQDDYTQQVSHVARKSEDVHGV